MLGTLSEGYRQFSRTGITPTDAYLAFRQLYCRTKGEVNAVIGKHLSSLFPKPPLPEAISSIFGSFTAADIRGIASALLHDGSCCLTQGLPSPAVAELNESMDREASKDGGFDSSGNQARTMYPESALLACSVMTKVATDPLLYFVVSEYLNVEPVLTYVNAWISRPHRNTPETLSSTAQLFHFDMSHPRFLKAFIYLNDVCEANGPHCVVPKTHREKAEALWRDARISDEEMSTYYPKETWKVHVGGAGSVILVDTSAFHKGVPLVEGHRRLAEFYYTDTLFGEHVPTNKSFPAFDHWQFGGDIRDCTPRLFSRYAARLN